MRHPHSHLLPWYARTEPRYLALRVLVFGGGGLTLGILGSRWLS